MTAACAMEAEQVLEVLSDVETDPESEDDDRALQEYALQSDSDPEDLPGPSNTGRTTSRTTTAFDWHQISAGNTIIDKTYTHCKIMNVCVSIYYAGMPKNKKIYVVHVYMYITTHNILLMYIQAVYA